MEMVNAVYAYREQAGERQDPALLKEAVELVVLVLAPFAPHLAEEAWEALGYRESVHLQPWPQYDPQAVVEEEIELVLQVNGKVRDRVRVPKDADEETLREYGAGVGEGEGIRRREAGGPGDRSTRPLG